MTNEEITEGNKLIAKFMNEKIHNSKDVILLDEDHSQFDFHGGVCGLYSHNNRMYHNSWDWLVLVVEKISKYSLIGAKDHTDVCYPITFNMPDEEGNVMFRFKGCTLFRSDNLIEAAWRACVEFIEFQNNNKNE